MQGLAKQARWLIVTALVIAPLAGCTRAFYRRQADSETNCVVDQKAAAVGSAPGRYRIDINPMSRMYDPYDPDRPPMPPDDPTSNTILQCVDGKHGAVQWSTAERTPYVENPDWTEYLPLDEEGTLVLDLPGAVQVALLHAPDYQEELEDLYLSALDVTFERFRFDTQFFGGSSIFYTADGYARAGADGSSSVLNVSPSAPTSNLRLNRLTATGGNLVVGLANSLVWQFAGPDDYTGVTLLDFSLVQPLLRGAGRAVVLERLTIAERTLIANVRSMERYQRGFYLNIATGLDAGQGPSRRGGVFGGAGLEGFSGVGGGGFGAVGGFFGGFGQAQQGGGFTGGAGAAAAGGYIGLLQSAQVLRNQRANVAALKESVAQLVASYEAGRIDRFQVDLARQALYNAQSQLLLGEASLQSTLDNFKGDLGLPPDLPLRLSDDMLDRFNLRGDEIVDLQANTSQLASQLRTLASEREDAADEQAETPPEEQLPAPEETVPEIVPEPESEEGVLIAERYSGVAEDAREQLAAVREDFAELQRVLPQRKEHLRMLSGREEVDDAGINPQIFSPDRLQQRVEALERDIDTVSARMLRVTAQMSDAADAAEAGDEEAMERLRSATSDLSSALLELSLLQARARLDAIDIPPTELTPEDALTIASRYRRDWANARASLVDTWRLVTFNANDLRSDLDIVFSGDLGNVGDNPLNLRGSNGRLRVGLEFDGPLTRVSERNVYRQSLIEYQQARRDYYRFVDRVYQGLRATLRQVRLNEVNLELRREAVLVAIAQVDITQLRLSEPPRPGVDQELSNTTARDLVQALSDLLNVQNDFLSVWVNNEVQLLSLEFDLGLMQVDASGLYVPLGVPLRTFLDAPPCFEDDGGAAPIDGEPGMIDAGPGVAPLRDEEDAAGMRFPPGVVDGAPASPIQLTSWTERQDASEEQTHPAPRRLPAVMGPAGRATGEGGHGP